MGGGVFQAHRRLRFRNSGLRALLPNHAEDRAETLPCARLFNGNAPELPPGLGAAVKPCPGDSGFGHADAVPGGVDGRSRFERMIAGRKRIPVVLLPLKSGTAEGRRVLEENAERLGQLVVLLDAGLIVGFL